ncbi:amidohydrolase family protein [Microbacterium sp.]|uniref:amidohydrolase family protein n=1 Tax=Microbacterium sp. TaxID=51671 RepID=UPI003C78CA00
MTTVATSGTCDVDKVLGTLEAGKIADAVVVKGNPLDDIDSLANRDNILLVFKDGKVASNRGAFAV